jgi:putative methionine-R-sulfoxide reductase with GAF domain
MSFASVAYPEDKAARYEMMIGQIRALTDGITHPIANLANTAALLWQGMPDSRYRCAVFKFP